MNRIAAYLRRLDGNQRLMAVIAVAAVCVFTWQYFSAGNTGQPPAYFGTPYFREPPRIGPLGTLPARNVITPPPSQSLAEASGAGDVPADRHARPYRRWRDCTADRRHCGPWQYGPAPGDR